MTDSSASSARLVAASVTVGLGITLSAYFVYKKIQQQLAKQRIPEKWRRIGTLKDLYFYPVKSCGPLKNLSPEKPLNCEILGLQLGSIRDKSFMLVDAGYKMVTARTYPKMVLIQTRILDDTQLEFNAENMESLELDLKTLGKESPGKDVITEVWNVKINVMLCGAKFDKWFSKCILGTETGLHLVYYPFDKPVRSLTANMKIHPNVKLSDTGTFFDETSYMIINLASVADLNMRLVQQIPHQQFRSSFYLKMDNDEPFAEDHWQWLKIGNDCIFRVVAPCTRCIVPNINPDTGERDPNFEPLKTLRAYRKFPNLSSPAFGVHLGLRQRGQVKIDDVIYIADT